MSKKRKNKKSQRQAPAARPNTPLAKHKQKGKVLNSPFGDLPNLKAVPWLRDQLPDYLWVCLHLAGDLDEGRSCVVATMNLVNEILDSTLGNSAKDRPVFDGSLTSWEALPPVARDPILDALEDRAVHDLVIPEDFVLALSMYRDAPGSWLLSRWRSRDGFRVDPADAERVLAHLVIAGSDGQDQVATQCKMLAFRAVLIAQRIEFGDIQSINLLPRWPDDLDDEERARVESFVRAAFNAISMPVLDHEGSGRLEWAKQFWRSNWRLYPCRVAEHGASDLDAGSIQAAVAEAIDRVNALWESFEAAAAAVDPDLYEPDRFEVLSGLAARSLRIASSAIHSPAEWTIEHSAANLRALIETLIIISWLTKREDPLMYLRFKEYGRGRLKLLKLHWEEFADSLDEVPEEVQANLDHLDALVNQDISEEFQNINLGGSFSGLDTRKMAYEVGLETDYRLVFAPSSSDAHGEWGHLDRYVLTRCRNPTHRWHRIPRQSALPPIDPWAMTRMLEITERVIGRFVDSVNRPAPDPASQSVAESSQEKPDEEPV